MQAVDDDPLSAGLGSSSGDEKKSAKVTVDESAPLAKLDVTKLAVKKKKEAVVVAETPPPTTTTQSIESLRLSDGSNGLFSSGPSVAPVVEEKKTRSQLGFVGRGEDDSGFEDLMVASLLEREKVTSDTIFGTSSQQQEPDLPLLPDDQLLERLERAAQISTGDEKLHLADETSRTTTTATVAAVESSSIADDFDFNAYIAKGSTTSDNSGLFE